MRNVHCDGCGFIEPSDLPKSKRKIEEVTLTISIDSRFPIIEENHTADLCPGCKTLLLSTYFKVVPDTPLELAVPSFISFEDLTEVRHGKSAS